MSGSRKKGGGTSSQASKGGTQQQHREAGQKRGSQQPLIIDHFSQGKGQPPAKVSRKSEASESDVPSAPEAMAAEANVCSTPSHGMERAPTQGGSRARKTTTQFQDAVHGLVELPPLLMAIVDTEPFQRLRRCKQLGTAYYVFPGATHTRFEHSIGVAWLAKLLMRQIQEKQEGLEITKKDILCVMLAGLCHDMGHGPFSHQYEMTLHTIIKGLPEGDLRERLQKWSHEEMSVQMLHYAIELGGIDVSLPEYGGLDEQDMLFVRELIVGKEPAEGAEKEGGRDFKMRRGRGPEKAWMYDIINNVDSHFDVDKRDYLERDSKAVVGDTYKNFESITASARVCRVFGLQDWHADTADNYRLAICYCEEVVGDAANFFKRRFDFHLRIYQHPCVCGHDQLVADMLMLAHKHITVPCFGSDERMSIAEAALNPAAFIYLDDGVLQSVIHSESRHPDMLRAKELWRRLNTRQLYNVIPVEVSQTGDAVDALTNDSHPEMPIWEQSADDVAQEIVNLYNNSFSTDPVDNEVFSVPDSDNEDAEDRFPCSQFAIRDRKSSNSSSGGRTRPAGALQLTDIAVLKNAMNYGAKDKNPVDKMFFYYKNQDTQPGWDEGLCEAHQVSSADKSKYPMPGVLEWKEIRILCKDPSKKDMVYCAFREWIRHKNLSSPLGQCSQQMQDYQELSQSAGQSQQSS